GVADQSSRIDPVDDRGRLLNELAHAGNHEACQKAHGQRNHHIQESLEAFLQPGDTDGGAQGNPGQAAQKGDQQDQTGISGQLHAQNQAQIGQQQKDAGKVDQHAGGHTRGNDSQLAYRGHAAAGSEGGKTGGRCVGPGASQHG